MNHLVKFNPREIISAQKSKFINNDVFESECEFAIQALRKNSYLADTAQQNPQSLIDAITNVAKIGISLDPSKAHAYLVPRKIQKFPCVVLDISYRGLCHVAVTSKSVAFCQSKIVRRNDKFEMLGIDKEPLHKFDAFATDKARGDVIGAYCVAKTLLGDYLSEAMNKEQIDKIKARSEAAKKNAGPWMSDYEEMAKKTVIKRASKLWPIGDGKLLDAVEVVNQHQGIDFQEESSRAINETELKNLEKLCACVENGVTRVLSFVTKLHQDKIVFGELKDLSELDYLKAVSQLTQIINSK